MSKENQHEALFRGFSRRTMFGVGSTLATAALAGSLNNWLRRLPPEMVTLHLGLDAATIRTIPAEKLEFVG
jgi:hypothetical protein